MNLANRNFSLLAAIGFVFLSILPFSVSASNEALTDLLKVLMEKGTITADEYTILKAAAQRVTEKTSIMSADKMVTLEKKTRKLSAETNWAEKIRIEGDIRTRYQYEKKDGNEERSRGRIRYRLGVIANPITNWTIGGGLASGGSDPRSTNQDMKDGFVRLMRERFHGDKYPQQFDQDVAPQHNVQTTIETNNKGLKSIRQGCPSGIVSAWNVER